MKYKLIVHYLIWHNQPSEGAVVFWVGGIIAPVELLYTMINPQFTSALLRASKFLHSQNFFKFLWPCLVGEAS